MTTITFVGGLIQGNCSEVEDVMQYVESRVCGMDGGKVVGGCLLVVYEVRLYAGQQ
jgi:hypothetical protein